MLVMTKISEKYKENYGDQSAKLDPLLFFFPFKLEFKNTAQLKTIFQEEFGFNGITELGNACNIVILPEWRST